MKIKKYIKTDNLTEQQIAALKAAGINLEVQRSALRWEEVEKINHPGVYLKTKAGKILYCPTDRLTKYLQRERLQSIISG